MNGKEKVKELQKVIDLVTRQINKADELKFNFIREPYLKTLYNVRSNVIQVRDELVKNLTGSF